MIVSEETRYKVIDEYFEKFLKQCPRCKTEEDVKLIRKAFELAKRAHNGMNRKTGEPHIFHPINVARIVSTEIGLGANSISGALLHEIIEISNYTIDDIQKHLGDKVARIVRGLIKIPKDTKNDAQFKAENFRKLLFSLSEDVRVIFIKLADRLHNMRTVDVLPREKQIIKAGETLDLYAPLAHRLGLYSIKTELEDLSFKTLQPFKYKEISEKLKTSEKRRVHLINRFSLQVQHELEKLHYKYDITGRTKSIYSIWKKMETKKVPFEEVYDILAIRIVFEPKPDEDEAMQCWNIYSTISKLFEVKNDRIRDWVTKPKDTGYESLHVTVLGPSNEWVEIQIRTKRMHEIAELGYAAHWKYKGLVSEQSSFDKWIKKAVEALENPEIDALEFLDTFKRNLFTSEILVFTPKGQIISLPENATALDFAFSIHSELGYHCIGAQVGAKIYPIYHVLQSGDKVKILTSEKAKPKKEWLDFAITPKAKNFIKQSLNIQKKTDFEKGKTIIHQKFKELDVHPDSSIYKALLTSYNLPNKRNLYSQIGSEKISEEQLTEDLNRIIKRKNVKFWKLQLSKRLGLSFDRSAEQSHGERHTNGGYGESEIVYVQASCCHPVPGDEVVGYKSGHDEIIIHCSDCKEILKLIRTEPGNIIDAKWTLYKQASFISRIRISAIEREDLLINITSLIANSLDIKLKMIHFENVNGILEGHIDIYVHTSEDLTNLHENLENVKGVKIVERETI